MSAVTPCPSLPSLVDIYLRVDELGLSCKQPDTQTRAGASIAMGKGGHVSQYLDRGDTITNPPPLITVKRSSALLTLPRHSCPIASMLSRSVEVRSVEVLAV